VEQLACLRSTPGLLVWRPCDAVETSAAWLSAVGNADVPSALALSRQPLKMQPRDRMAREEKKDEADLESAMNTIRRGGYILRECKKGEPELLLLATGSEVALAMDAAEALEARGVQVRVVSLPCTQLFDQQEIAWRSKVLPQSVRNRIAIEASYADWWRKYVGLDGSVIGMQGFGKSAPGGVLFKYYGFTVENVLRAAEKMLGLKDKEKA
jgi:transketolase